MNYFAEVHRSDGRVERAFVDEMGQQHFYLASGDTVLVMELLSSDCISIMTEVTFNGLADTTFLSSGARYAAPGTYSFVSICCFFLFPGELSFTIHEASSSLLSCHVWLDALYDPAAGMMSDAYREQGILNLLRWAPVPPVLGVAPASYCCTLPIPASLQVVSGPNAISAWVRLEWRSALDPTTIVLAKYYLLQRDGDLMDMDGNEQFHVELPIGDYHIAVRHRTHLGAMTMAWYHLDTTALDIDFRDTTLLLFGSEAVRSAYGTRLLWAGNVSVETSSPQEVKYAGSGNDRDKILDLLSGQVMSVLPVSLTDSYFDLNSDGVIQYAGANNDRDVILRTIDPLSPTSVRLEQLPY